MEISKTELTSQILNANITENHTLLNVGDYFILKEVNKH